MVRKSVGVKLGLLAFGCVLALGLAEGVCRIFLRSQAQAQFDDQLNMRTDFYRLVEGSKRGFEIRPHATEEINSHGMRMREIPEAKPAGTFRILVLGDSIAYGIGVSIEETFSFVLEKQLRERYPERSIEVLNAGVISYNTEQELDWLNERGMKFGPDAVVVAHCPNDVHATPIVFREGDHLRYFRAGEARDQVSPFLVEHSAFYRVILMMREVARARDRGRYRPNADLKFNLLSDSESQFGSLAELIGTARSKDLPIIVCSFPYLKVPFDQYLPDDWEAYRGLLKAVTELKVPFVDLFAAWRDTSHKAWLRPEAPNDFVHPNAKGHADAAQRLAQWFIGRNILEKP